MKSEPTFRRRYPGFPKRLPCLVCDRLRVSHSPSERIHASCRKARLAQCAVEFTTLDVHMSTEEVDYQ
jgi:hypothetical protein